MGPHLPDTVAVLSLGLLVEELRFSYVWNPWRCPFLRRGNLTVRCHPTNNVPFICPGASVEAGDVPGAAGDREQWEQAGTEDDDKSEGPPELEVSVSENEAAAEEEDVPKVRSRP